MLSSVTFFKCLADETRLSSLLLITQEEELCVCELTCALALSQPKVSRHLALLKASGLLNDRRDGQWVYYRLANDLPGWMVRVLQQTLAEEESLVREAGRRLAAMGNRPERLTLCC